IRMAMEIGAAVGGFGGTIDFCGKTGAATDNRNPVFPSFIVNKKGRRFVCEDATYAYHYRAIFQQEKQLDGPTYMIFGKSSLSAKGAPWTAQSVAADIAAGVVFTADTIEKLAAKISTDPKNLAATLAAWNSDMKNKKDNQFDRVSGLAQITGPFYAYKNVSFNLGAIGGVKINVYAQALKPNGEVIPRLYVGGLNAAGWIGPYYPGSGTAIIGTVHWGRRAGSQAARLKSI
ncbi:MAG: succinate dehydrogenase/fumarate reductase flavoprotein subunit, partial [Clostridiales bacterium]|nr:succinate dehydrogenase/fumarate reductase flavoprotein subunit [Clostridiales bacterium]